MTGTARTSGWVRFGAALVLSVAALSAGAGSAAAASAAPPERAVHGEAAAAWELPGQAVRALCGHWEETWEVHAPKGPATAAPVRVCKMVNGWD
ncbi:hypothetical protein I3F58_01130 [Streptomyces sp. MUM 203J]|uniref:hypothetical protein n=1 Tax=Streptomyces sp. MUM 203J TaxID=2791990 RepID=UPI001F04D5F5|nr:hypothetical protein [Streptomyces sp. MUM 203J]MCH0538184.1 hypothetical protein [Streptomyces sp. MUM 203J]